MPDTKTALQSQVATDDGLEHEAMRKFRQKLPLTAREEKLLRMRYGLEVDSDTALPVDMPASNEAARKVLEIQQRALAELQRRRRKAAKKGQPLRPVK